MEALLGNHSAQRPASVCVASPGHAMGHCKVKCSLCSVQQVWWSLHWVLRPRWWAGVPSVDGSDDNLVVSLHPRQIKTWLINAQPVANWSPADQRQ